MIDTDSEFVLWTLHADHTSRTEIVTLEWLIAHGHLSVAAERMSEHDVMHQYNNVNGGEQWLTIEGEPAPVLALRTEANPDGSDPQRWAFYLESRLRHRPRPSPAVDHRRRAHHQGSDRMTHDDKIVAYNAALAAGDTELARELADDLLYDIFGRIMVEDEYQARTHA